MFNTISISSSGWPNADHQDLHHDSEHMMPILPRGIPFSISNTADHFFKFFKNDDWRGAARMVARGEVSINISDRHCNNIFDFAVEYLAHRADGNVQQLQPLFYLVDQAIKEKVTIRMNYAFYMNPLHILARVRENDVNLKLLDILLKHIDPIYISAYNKFGKTPLLEALSKKNTKTALKFLEQPGINVNHFKIHSISKRHEAYAVGIIENYNIKHGSSAFEAAAALGLISIATAIESHPTYDRNLQYSYPDSGDVIRIEHFLLAEKGNVDTFKVLFKNYDAEILMGVDELYWTMLNVACFAANVPVVEFLLDKNKLDIVSGYIISEDLYMEFVNRRDDLFFTALGRILIAAGQNYDMKTEEQISLFIKCRYFKVNDALQCTGKALIHYIAENNLISLMIELSEREDVNYDKENLQGQTALEVASIAGNFEMVELLSKLVLEKKAVINPNRYSRKCALVERLDYFMEENWFGPVSIEGLTVDDLIEIYRTKEPHKVQITYQEFLIEFSVTYVSGNIVDDPESIKQHLAYCANRMNNSIEMTLVDWPKWIDHNLYSEIKKSLKKRFGEHFLLEGKFNLDIHDTLFEVIAKPKRRQQMTSVGTITYEILCEFLGGEDSREQREEMLSADYMSLLATVITQAQQEENDDERGSLIKVVKCLVKFPKIKLNILIKNGENVFYIDEIVVLQEIRDIIENSRFENKNLLSVNKTNLLSEKIKNSKQNSSSLYKFAKAFSSNIERKNLERKFYHFFSGEEYRRMDALARLFEADGVCAAVYFDEDTISYSTNSPNNGTLKQHQIIRDALNYFSKCGDSVLVDEKINLIRRIVEAKSMAGLAKQKASIYKEKVLDILIESIIKKISTIEKIISEKKLKLDKENVLTKQSFQQILSVCNIGQYIELNKTDVGDPIFSHESFQKRINAVIKFFVRALLDLRKIEDYIRENPRSNFSQAFTNNKHKLVGEMQEYHAEMKLLNDILNSDFQHHQYYIGVSKLCCAHCNLIFSYFVENLKYSNIIKTRGAHGEDSKWSLPDFMKTIDGFVKIFGHDQQFCDLFRNSYNESPKETLEFIQVYSTLKDQHDLDFLYESLARGNRSQEHAWSDSDSDSEPASDLDISRAGLISRPILKNFKEYENIFTSMREMGFGKEITSMSEEEYIKLAMTLSLQENNQEFDLNNNRFVSELGLYGQQVTGDGFCFFRAIAKQIVDRQLNAQRFPPLSLLPVTLEEVLERVAIYFNQNSSELMNRVFPSPRRQDYGTGDQSEALYRSALADYNNPQDSQQRAHEFRDNFYEYINLGRYDTNGRLVNAADWLPQVMSDVLQIEIDIYDGQQAGAGPHVNNRHHQRIGLGRINNNHYISLDGDLEAAWLAEKEATAQVKFYLEKRQLNFFQGKSITINPQFTQFFQQNRILEWQSFLLKPEFMLKQLIQARAIGKYIMDKIQESLAKERILKILNEVNDDVRQEVLNELLPIELEALWKVIQKLDGYEKLKANLWKLQGKEMCVVTIRGGVV
jgi:ankyrin repeat protein